MSKKLQFNSRIFCFLLVFKRVFSLFTNFSKKYVWRFFIFALVVIVLLAGLNFRGVAKNISRAFKSDNLKSLTLTARFASSSPANFDYALGWWNEGNIMNMPEVSETANSFYFSDVNSLFYNGGLFILLIDGFDNELIPEKNDLSDYYEVEFEVSSSTADIIDTSEGEIATSSEEDNNKDYNEESVTSTIDEVLEDNKLVATSTMEITASSTNMKEEIEGDIISKLFKTVSAQDELEMPGEFDHAKINFSMALSLISYDTNNLPVYPGGGDEEEGDEINEQVLDNNFSTSTDIIEDGKMISASSSEGLDIASSSYDEVFEDDAVSLTELKSDEIIEIYEIQDESDIEVIETLEDEETISSPIEENTFKEIEMISSSTENVLLDEESVTSTEENLNFSLWDVFKTKSVNAQREAVIKFWYRIKDDNLSSSTLWYEITSLFEENLSNEINGGYFSYDLPEVNSWEDLRNVELKIEGLGIKEPNFVFYLDSTWLEVFFHSDNLYENNEERKERWGNSLIEISEHDDISITNKEELRFKYIKNNENIFDGLGDFFGIGGYWSDVNLKAYIVDAKGEAVDTSLTIIFEDDGEFSVRIDNVPDNFVPGRYSLEFEIIDSSGDLEEIKFISQDFSWGVLVFNSNKSIYSPLEEAFLQVGVVDDQGHTICDAQIEVKITPPSGMVTYLSTGDGSLEYSPECGPESVTNRPDYFGYYETLGEGKYGVKITANTKNGIREMNDSFFVKNNEPFEIERIGPTRIYPQAPYQMRTIINVKSDFRGDVSEIVPASFVILGNSIRLINSNERDVFGSNYKYLENENNENTILIWEDVEFTAGDLVEIIYSFDAPDISPAEFLLGPLSLRESLNYRDNLDDNGTYLFPLDPYKDISFQELRQWQIASDAVMKRAKTVMFFAGAYSGDGSTGQNTNTNYTFSQFNLKLAETGVVIKSAFVEYEAMIESYSSGNGNYTGYDLYFDSCEESCTADATGGTNRILQTDSTVLAYNGSESSQVRILFDVSNESELANYVGGGAELEAQLGYNIKQGSTINSVANAKAILYVTYAYDSDSENLTNTVIYPLDSTNSGDTGSRQSSISACTKNSTCPTFSYNMELPEFPGVATTTNRISQWYKIHNANDTNNANDITMDLNLQTFDIDSANIIHECANAGTQGNFPSFYFGDWASSGYSENSSQQLEVYLNQGTNYALGGEVFETYIASSSASVKTRTVVFPFGVVSNGQSTALASKDVDIYFPENGSGSGVVTVKSAWVRILPTNPNSATLNTTVSTKTGANATSSNYVYDYNGGGSIIKSVYTLYHIIPSADYSELAGANKNTAKTVRLNLTQSATTYGGISAELVITYTYTSETSGYLTNLSINGGQSTSYPGTSVNVSTANAVMPETGGKTLLGARLHSSYLNSDSSGGGVPGGSVFKIDANLGVSTPTCTNNYVAEPDDINSFAEMIKDVTSAMNTTDNQAYTACYSDDESLSATDGAKMNGILNYTYSWTNDPPTGSFNSADLKLDGSGVIDVSVEIADPNNQESRAKLEYEAGSACAFTIPLDPTLDELDSNTTADYGDPEILNANTYQIGVDGAYITTASGSNSVLFDWQSQSDIPNVEGTYCIRLTANDQIIDQTTLATTTVYIDNLIPSNPGDLSLNSRTGTKIVLNYGATTTETNFYEYKIFYKQYDGSDPDEGDSLLGSSTDANLGNILFNDIATTSVSGLTVKTTYSFAIWAYDQYGNRSSSSRIDLMTNDAPTGIFNSASQITNGTGVVDISIEVDDNNNDNTNIARVDYVAGTSCDFSTPLDPTLDTNQTNIYSDFGITKIDNNQVYQVGSSSGYILTSPGSNTINFDWLGKNDVPMADGLYCLRLTVNDGADDQLNPATTTLTLDNTNPTASGPLTVASIGLNSVRLNFATASPATDTNEPISNAYRIYYKAGNTGVTRNDSEHDVASLDAYNFAGATSTLLSGLTSDTDYVINIWSFDKYGNVATSTELTFKTNSTINNESLTFTNPVSLNIAVADLATEWNFRAVVSESDGWYLLDKVHLRMADNNDNLSPFEDLEFTWSQSTQTFTDTGSDILSAVTLSNNSTSTCVDITCTIDFKLVINKNFASTSIAYDAELYSTNDTAKSADNSYAGFYEVRRVFVEQNHYRWRNDDGGE